MILTTRIHPSNPAVIAGLRKAGLLQKHEITAGELRLQLDAGDVGRALALIHEIEKTQYRDF